MFNQPSSFIIMIICNRSLFVSLTGRPCGTGVGCVSIAGHGVESEGVHLWNVCSNCS